MAPAASPDFAGHAASLAGKCHLSSPPKLPYFSKKFYNNVVYHFPNGQIDQAFCE
jgi:hypothetical protein